MNPYKNFRFYLKNNLSLYKRYHRDNPNLSASEAVWRVNAGLYRPFYENPRLITEPNPLLVNPYNRLPDDFIPHALEIIDGTGRMATQQTVAAFRDLQKRARRDGYNIEVTSAYRTLEYQRGLYERERGDGSVARPGFSEHHTGRALDLWGPDGLLDQNGATDTGRWVATNVYDYGFIMRYSEQNKFVTSYKPEPWHITYVGGKIAREIFNGGYGSLEEFVAKNPLLFSNFICDNSFYE